MSEQQKQSSEGKDANQVDLSNYVPKEEMGKLNQEVDTLRKSLEEAKLELVSPEYIEFLAAKKDRKVTQADVDKAKAAGLPAEAVAIIEELKGRIVRTESVLQNMAAVLELKEVESKYPDFKDYRDDVQKLLEADKTGSLSFEQAYYQARGMKPPAPKGDVASRSNEKPGGFLPPEASRVFKTDYEASQDAANQVRTKYGIVGDII